MATASQMRRARASASCSRSDVHLLRGRPGIQARVFPNTPTRDVYGLKRGSRLRLVDVGVHVAQHRLETVSHA
eukprot:731105-Pleurochrysis_carterae.AAC.1